MMNKLLGQVLCVGIPEEGLNAEFLDFFKEYLPGNFILFKRNTDGGPRALMELTRRLGSLTSQYGLPRPIICVDQEGGRVARLGPPHWPRLPSFGEIIRMPDPRGAISELAKQSAMMLEEVGINVNLAPCLDLLEEGAPNVMYERTLSDDPMKVAELGTYYIETLGRYGVAAVAKHFPGIGALDADPHLDFSVVRSSRERQSLALLPFKAAVQAGVLGVMTSHVLFPTYDPENIATFSRPIITILRKELGFQGIVFTDDLFMGAIERHYGLGDAGALALKAGHDMLLYCHDLEQTAKAIEGLRKQLEADDKLREDLSESSKRIIECKKGTLGRIYRCQN